MRVKDDALAKLMDVLLKFHLIITRSLTTAENEEFPDEIWEQEE